MKSIDSESVGNLLKSAVGSIDIIEEPPLHIFDEHKTIKINLENIQESSAIFIAEN